MKKKTFLNGIIFLSIAICFLFGCAKKGKEVKTIEGDPEILYKRGLTLFNKRDYSEALKKFEELKSNFPDSPPYTLWAELKVGDCHFFKKDYVEAIAAYEEFKKIHPTHEEMPYVQYQIGMSHFNMMRTPDRDQTPTKKALSSFEYLVSNFPPNLFTEKAKQKIKVCKEHLAGNEFEIGKFYYDHEKFQIAISHFKELLKTFPKMPREDRTLYFLGMSYLGLGQKEEAREILMKVMSEYPKSSHRKEIKMILDRDMRKPDTKILFVKIKAKEPERQIKVKKEDVESSPLIKFEDESKQPISLKGEKKVQLIKPEEKKASLPIPSPLPPVQAEPKTAVTPEEGKKPGEEFKITTGQTEEGRKDIPLQPETKVPSVSHLFPPVQGDPKIAVKPEEEKKPVEDLKITMGQAEEGQKAIPLQTESEVYPIPSPLPPVQAAPKTAVTPEEEKKEGEEFKITMGQAEEGRKAISPKPESKTESTLEKEKKVSSIPSTPIEPKKRERPKKEFLLESGEVKESKWMEPGHSMDITSDKVETYSKENRVIFKGNVTARQRDIVIYADSIEAMIVEDGKGIDKVIANGNVKIQQGLRVANCQKAVFYNMDQKVIMTGDPKIWEGENMVSGDEIVFDIKQNRVEVKGGEGEGGKARIYPGEKIEKLK